MFTASLLVIPRADLNGVGAVFDIGGKTADGAILLCVGAGGFTDIEGAIAIGGTITLCEAPKGVGALCEMGGNPRLGFVVAFETGVGAFIDIGGATAIGELEPTCEFPKGVGPFFDIGGNAAFVALTMSCVEVIGVGAFFDIGGMPAAGPAELTGREMIGEGAFFDIGGIFAGGGVFGTKLEVLETRASPNVIPDAMSLEEMVEN